MRYIKQVGNGADPEPGPKNHYKVAKYNKKFPLERGIINCLARKTSSDCINPKKAETRKMDKNGRYCGCKNEFFKHTLKACSGCNILKHCSHQTRILLERIIAIMINQISDIELRRKKVFLTSTVPSYRIYNL